MLHTPAQTPATEVRSSKSCTMNPATSVWVLLFIVLLLTAPSLLLLLSLDLSHSLCVCSSSHLSSQTQHQTSRGTTWSDSAMIFSLVAPRLSCACASRARKSSACRLCSSRCSSSFLYSLAFATLFFLTSLMASMHLMYLHKTKMCSQDA